MDDRYDAKAKLSTSLGYCQGLNRRLNQNQNQNQSQVKVKVKVKVSREKSFVDALDVDFPSCSFDFLGTTYNHQLTQITISVVVNPRVKEPETSNDVYDRIIALCRCISTRITATCIQYAYQLY